MHLGPLLFILFINDISDHINHSSFSLYADDLKLFKVIKSTQDSEQFQLDLNSIVLYFNACKLTVNIDKCCCMRFTKNTVNKINNLYYLDGQILKFNETVRDLGVNCDCKLSFLPHIKVNSNKAYQMLGFVPLIKAHKKAMKYTFCI